MKTNILNDVSEFLNKLNIKHEVKDGVILVDRDSICNNINAASENDSYDALRLRLNDEFNARFLYICKNDEWLMLETL